MARTRIDERNGPYLFPDETAESLELWTALEDQHGKGWMKRTFPVGIAPRDLLERLRKLST